MLNVIIEAQGLRSAIKLKEILEDRRALVEFSKDKVESQDKHLSHRASEICFICSGAVLGGLWVDVGCGYRGPLGPSRFLWCKLHRACPICANMFLNNLER